MTFMSKQMNIWIAIGYDQPVFCTEHEIFNLTLFNVCLLHQMFVVRGRDNTSILFYIWGYKRSEGRKIIWLLHISKFCSLWDLKQWGNKQHKAWKGLRGVWKKTVDCWVSFLGCQIQTPWDGFLQVSSGAPGGATGTWFFYKLSVWRTVLIFSDSFNRTGKSYFFYKS